MNEAPFEYCRLNPHQNANILPLKTLTAHVVYTKGFEMYDTLPLFVKYHSAKPEMRVRLDQISIETLAELAATAGMSLQDYVSKVFAKGLRSGNIRRSLE